MTPKAEERLKRHFEAGRKVDLEGNCKFCGEAIASPGHLMHDPSGKGKPIAFCSAECLEDAEGIFEGISVGEAQQVRAAITAVRELN